MTASVRAVIVFGLGSSTVDACVAQSVSVGIKHQGWDSSLMRVLKGEEIDLGKLVESVAKNWRSTLNTNCFWGTRQKPRSAIAAVVGVYHVSRSWQPTLMKQFLLANASSWHL